MPQTWKTVRVFISSTFRDMQAERDQLVRFVFPRLKEELLKWRIHLIDVDLRWGVTSEQNAIEVCREVIDECRPRFICILGGRYGWVPPGKTNSITADEVHYGVLDRDLKDRGFPYFYFREEAATVAMVETTPGEFREPKGSWNEHKLAELKQAILAADLNPCTYPAHWDGESRRLTFLNDFGERVHGDLLESIRSDPELQDRFIMDGTARLDKIVEEDAAMEAFIAERSEHFVPGSRKTVLEELLAHANASGGNGYVCLTGEPGSGKSALLACLSQQASLKDQESTLLLCHFAGASPGSTDVRSTMRRLCQKLKEGCPDINSEIPDNLEELRTAFRDFLQQACMHRRVVILLDAVNQFEGGLYSTRLYWLPETLPANARFILSAIPGPALDELRHRPYKPVEIELQPLTKTDGEAIIAQFQERYRKDLEAVQRTALLEKADAGKPLYLLAALEELRTLGTYEEITRRIIELPSTIQSLFAWILERLENDDGFRDRSGKRLGYELVPRFGSLLGTSRFGLSQRELVELLAPGDTKTDPPGKPDQEGNVAALVHLLRPYLMQRGELLDFYHQQLKEAVVKRYLSGDSQRTLAHGMISTYFEKRWSEPSLHALRELPYHLQEIPAWIRLADLLTNTSYLHEYCFNFGPHDLLAYSEICLQNLAANERRASQISAVCEMLSGFGSLLAHEPEALVQQLYLSVHDHWADNPEVMQWAEKALDQHARKIRFRVARGQHSPQSPLFRNLGVQDDYVPGIDASADFGCLFSASMSGQLRCFEVVSGALLGETWVPKGNVLALKVSDENNVFLGLSDGRVLKWDGKQALAQVFRAPDDYSVNSLCVLAEPGLLLAGPGQWGSSPQSGKLYLLDLHTCQPVDAIDLNDRIVLTFSNGWQQRRLVNRGGVQVNEMVPRPHSHEVAFAFHHGEVSLYDLDRRQWRRIHTASTEAIFGIGFDEKGDHLFFADSAGRLVDFDLSSWTVRTMIEFPRALTAMTVSAAAERLFLGDWSGMLYVIDQADLRIRQSFPGELQGCARSLCCDPGGQFVAASGRSIRIYVVDTEEPAGVGQMEWTWQAMRAHGSDVLNICVATAEEIARAATLDTSRSVGLASFWDVHCARQIPLALAEKPGLEIFIVTLPDLAEILPIRIDGLQSVHGLTLDDQATQAACLVSTIRGSSIQVFQVDVRKKRVSLSRHFSIHTRPGRFTPIVFSPDLSNIAAVTSQCAVFSGTEKEALVDMQPVIIKIWQISSGIEQTLSMETPAGSLAFSRDGERLFVGTGTQYEYDEDPDKISLVEARRTRSGAPVDIHVIRVFDVRTGAELQSYKGHTDSITNLAVSADDKLLLSAADDHTLRLWDTQSHECLGLIGLEGKPLWCSFSSREGEIVVTCASWRADLRILSRIYHFENRG